MWPCRTKASCYTKVPFPLHPHISVLMRELPASISTLSLPVGTATLQSPHIAQGKMSWFA